MSDPDIDADLKVLNSKIDLLRQLQADAHPGLISWNTGVRNTLLDIKREAEKLTGP